MEELPKSLPGSEIKPPRQVKNFIIPRNKLGNKANPESVDKTAREVARESFDPEKRNSLIESPPLSRRNSEVVKADSFASPPVKEILFAERKEERYVPKEPKLFSQKPVSNSPISRNVPLKLLTAQEAVKNNKEKIEHYAKMFSEHSTTTATRIGATERDKKTIKSDKKRYNNLYPIVHDTMTACALKHLKLGSNFEEFRNDFKNEIHKKLYSENNSLNKSLSSRERNQLVQDTTAHLTISEFEEFYNKMRNEVKGK